MIFDDGWYEPNLLPPIARWMSSAARVQFPANDLFEISLDLTTHMPDVRERPLLLEFVLNDEPLTAFQLYRNGWLRVNFFVAESLVERATGNFELRIRADRTWRPRPANDEARDDREISIAVCNIEVKTGGTQPQAVASGMTAQVGISRVESST